MKQISEKPSASGIIITEVILLPAVTRDQKWIDKSGVWGAPAKNQQREDSDKAPPVGITPSER